MTTQELLNNIDIRKSYGNLFVEDFNIKPGNSFEENTSRLNLLILKAKTEKKTIVFGKGNFEFGQIEWSGEVSMVGAGWKHTTLKGVTATPLINYIGSVINEQPGPLFYGFKLDGNNTSTIGLNIRILSFFLFEELYIEKFTTRAVNAEGVLIGQWKRCFFVYNPNHYNAYLGSTAFQPNLVTFSDCIFSDCSGFGVTYSRAGHISFQNCNFERNGTSNDENTGSVKMFEMTPSGESLSLIMDNCWFEANHGTLVHINTPFGDSKSVISNCLMQYNTVNYGIKLESNTISNKLMIQNSKIINQGAVADLSCNGLYASVETIFSEVGSYTSSSGGSLFTHTPTLVTV